MMQAVVANHRILERLSTCTVSVVLPRIHPRLVSYPAVRTEQDGLHDSRETSRPHAGAIQRGIICVVALGRLSEGSTSEFVRR